MGLAQQLAEAICEGMSPRDRKLISAFNVFVMDLDADSPGWLEKNHPKIAKLSDKPDNKMTKKDIEMAIQFFNKYAPGGEYE